MERSIEIVEIPLHLSQGVEPFRYSVVKYLFKVSFRLITTQVQLMSRQVGKGEEGNS